MVVFEVTYRSFKNTTYSVADQAEVRKKVNMPISITLSRWQLRGGPAFHP